MRIETLALDRLFDGIVDESVRWQAPAILYHYTDWTGARGILCKQHIWETAHDCTNDEAELVSANEVIIEVARKLRKSAKRTAAAVLDLFINSYLYSHVAKLKTVYLACFSVARDDEKQWKSYADDGRGLCLGIRVLNEPVPESKEMGSALVRVDYSESSWRSNLAVDFGKVVSLLERAPNSPRNVELGWLALHRIAAFASITAKHAEWAPEQEYRHVTLFHDGVSIPFKERRRGDKIVRYLDAVPLRAGGKQLAFAEIITGPNQDGDAKDKLLRLLEEAGYKPGTPEYPEITYSRIARWDLAPLAAKLESAIIY